jgi:hypothetical protein
VNTAKWSETQADTDASRGSIEMDAKVCVIVVPLCYNNGVAVLLHWCYFGDTVVLQRSGVRQRLTLMLRYNTQCACTTYIFCKLIELCSLFLQKRYNM